MVAHLTSPHTYAHTPHRTNVQTIAEVLKAEGYATHAIGKVRLYLSCLAPI